MQAIRCRPFVLAHRPHTLVIEDLGNRIEGAVSHRDLGALRCAFPAWM
jgi:hypothetical protein